MIFSSSITHSQVMLPAYQAVQYSPLPIITTTAMSEVSGRGATSGGNVIRAGSSPVTASGVCYSTSPNPKIENGTVITNTAGTASFTSTLTGLTKNSVYYLRAYATNSAGTSYGEEVVFEAAVKVGAYYQGGTVAYVYASGDKGYDANIEHGYTISILTTSYAWANPSKAASGTTNQAGDGPTNTNYIVLQIGTTAIPYAAKICDDLVVGSYSDWFLPSLGDMGFIQRGTSTIAGIGSGLNWTSTQASSTTAYAVGIDSGAAFGTPTKTTSYGVVAARFF